MSIPRTRILRFAAAAAVPFVLAAALPLADGMTYEFVMKSQSTRSGNKEAVSLRGRGTYAGDDARLEIIQATAQAGGSEAFGGKGSYFIIKDGGKEMYMVDPGQKQYMKWDMMSMFAGMGKMMNAMGGMVKMQMTDVAVSAQDLGAGESLQGYPTRHFRVVQNYTMTASMFGRASKNRNESTIDYYFAPSLKIANPFVSNSQQMAMVSQFDMFNNADYKTQMAAANAKLPRTGVPLKTVTTTKSTDDKGKAETTVTTMEMVNFKSTSVPASTFAIPTGYTMIEMPNLDAAMSANGGAAGSKTPGFNADSVAAAAKQGAKEGVTEGTKEAVKEAAKNKIKGVFGRKKKN
ncbi:MAG: hypothetical protein ABIS03_12330 [Gemmatimonadaceae bacterium]